MLSDFTSNQLAYAKAIVALVTQLIPILIIWGLVGDDTADKINQTLIILTTVLGAGITTAAVVVTPNTRYGQNVDKHLR